MGDWERALKLSNEAYKVSKDYVAPLLCKLWERIETETTGSQERAGSIAAARNCFACNP